jgi:serine/threonine protein kinase
MTKSIVGSPIYMAPELLAGKYYNNKADIWSLGVLLYEMIFGKCPYEENSMLQLLKLIQNKPLEFP